MKPAVTKAVVAKPAAGKPAAAKLAAAKPIAAKAAVAKPVASKPAAAKSVVAKPVKSAAKPTATPVAKAVAKPAEKALEKVSDKASAKLAATDKAAADKPVGPKPVEGKSAAGKLSGKTPTQPAKVAADAAPRVPQLAIKPITPFNAKLSKSALAKAALAAAIAPSKPLKLSKAARAAKLAKLKANDPPVRLPPPPVTSDSKMQKNRAGLTSKELEHFRDLLLEKRRELLGDVTSMEREALRSGNTNLSNLPLHMADTGTDNYEQEFTLGLVEKDRQLLREINIALAKIQDGSYGVCEGTGKPIAKPRLEAQPWAKYSIEHARQLEKPQFRRAY